MEDMPPRNQDVPEVPAKKNGTINQYLVVVIALAVIAVVIVAGLVILSIRGQAAPESLIALGGVALGTLVGIVAPAQRRN